MPNATQRPAHPTARRRAVHGRPKPDDQPTPAPKPADHPAQQRRGVASTPAHAAPAALSAAPLHLPFIDVQVVRPISFELEFTGYQQYFREAQQRRREALRFQRHARTVLRAHLAHASVTELNDQQLHTSLLRHWHETLPAPHHAIVLRAADGKVVLDIYAMLDGHHHLWALERHLHRHLPGLFPLLLSTLEELSRNVYPTAGPQGAYHLTPYGWELEMIEERLMSDETLPQHITLKPRQLKRLARMMGFNYAEHIKELYPRAYFKTRPNPAEALVCTARAWPSALHPASRRVLEHFHATIKLLTEVGKRWPAACEIDRDDGGDDFPAVLITFQKIAECAAFEAVNECYQMAMNTGLESPTYTVELTRHNAPAVTTFLSDLRDCAESVTSLMQQCGVAETALRS